MSDLGYDDDEQKPEEIEQANVFETNKLGEVELQPYDPTRVMAAQAMKLHYGFVDPSGIDQFKETKVYPGLMRDMAIVLWLCSLTDIFEIDQAARSPVSAAAKAVAWAHKQKIDDQNSDQFWEAHGIFFGLMGAIAAAKTMPKDTQKKTRERKKRR